MIENYSKDQLVDLANRLKKSLDYSHQSSAKLTARFDLYKEMISNAIRFDNSARVDYLVKEYFKL